MLVKCTIFILLKLAYFDMKNKGTGNKSQSRDENLNILLYSICILPSYDGSYL